MSRRSSRGIVAALLLALAAPAVFLPSPAWGDDTLLATIESDLERRRQSLRRLNEILEIHKTKAPSGFVAAILGDANPDFQRYRRQLETYTSQLAAEEQAYREALSADLIARLDGKTAAEQQDYVGRRYTESVQYNQLQTERARNILTGQLRAASSAEDRARAFATAEALLRTARLDEEMAAGAQRRLGGIDDSSRMRDLMRAATAAGPTYAHEFPDSQAREAEDWLRGHGRDAHIDEYRRLARSGLIRDPNVDVVLTGTVREEVARDAERALADQLRSKSLQPNRYDILRWFVSKDPRKSAEEELRAEIGATPEYRALDLLSPGTTDASPDYFRGLALAVREQQNEISKWRTDLIPGSKITTGAGTAHIIGDNAGEMSLTQVDARIGRYQKDADAVVAALEAAAASKGDTSGLDPEHRRLLRNYGYLRQDAAGNERLAVPTGARQLAGLTGDLNLPGARLLDMVSAANAYKLLASTVLPQAAAGNVGRLLGVAGASERAVALGMTAADVIVGAGTDAAFQYAETGKVDAARLAIDSTLMRAGLGGAGHATDAVATRLASNFANPAVRKNAEAFLKEAIGLPSEAALQSYYEASMSGSGMSYDSFLANLYNGAMARRFASAANSDQPSESGAGQPAWFKQIATDDPDLGGAVVMRQQELARRYETAHGRLADVLGEAAAGQILAGRPSAGDEPLAPAPSREQLANRISHALESGQMSWPELKMLYAQNPGLEPVLQTVADKRKATFVGLVARAQELARADLDTEARLRRGRLEENLADHPDQLRDALAQHDRWYAGEKARIETTPESPGSGNITSDIDRSSESERVRKYLRTLYEQRVGHHEAPLTSAQAYDVNEYMNVFPTISRGIKHGRELDALPATGEFRGMSHAEAVEAGGLAGAMLHMTPAQRERFRENRLRSAPNDEARRLLQKQFSAADVSLTRTDENLRAEMDRLVAENPGLAANQVDLTIRARDNLYQKRAEAIREKQFRVDELERQIDDAGGDAARTEVLTRERDGLLGEIERDWSTAMREGIETYSTFAALDTIVINGQIKKISPRALIEDPNFTREKLTEQGRDYSPEQIRGIMDDQVMMMTHHMNGFHEGHEGTTDAASAMGKYAERAVLGLKLSGADMTTKANADLNNWSRELVENRKDPQKLREVLKKIAVEAGHGPDAEAGLLAFAKMVEAAVPGAEGLFVDPSLVHAHSAGGDATSERMRRARAEVASRRRLDEEKHEAAALGPETAAAENAAAVNRLDDELGTIRAQREKRRHLRENYREQDWKAAEALEEERNTLLGRRRVLEALGADGSALQEVDKELAANNRQLAALGHRFAAEGGAASLGPDAEDVRLANLLAAKERELAEREAGQPGLDKAAEEARQTRSAERQIFPESAGRFEPLELPAVAPGSKVRITLMGASVEIPVR